MVLNGELRAAYDDRLLAEYRELLARERFGFAPEDVAAVLAYLETEGEWVMVQPLVCELPDPDDLPFLEVVAQTEAALITGNSAHYPEIARGKVQVMTPGAFIRAWRS